MPKNKRCGKLIQLPRNHAKAGICHEALTVPSNPKGKSESERKLKKQTSWTG